MRKEYPTQEQIKKVLDYDQITGVFTWKKRPIEMFKQGIGQTRAYNTFNSRYAGKKAGKYDENGYLSIVVYPIKTRCLAHRLAWILIHGYDPIEVDHKNRNNSYNPIDNLRETTHMDNLKNFGLRHDSESGVNGVTFHKRYKAWRARIKVNYKSIHLGMFPEFIDAVKSRYEAEIKYGFTDFNPESTAYKYLQEDTMDYEYTTTSEMDEALSAEAEKQGKTAEHLFAEIITADMGTLTRNYEATKKDQVYEAYKADPESKVKIDASILAAKPIKAEPIIEAPIEEVIK
jgi:hypothetical protein